MAPILISMVARRRALDVAVLVGVLACASCQPIGGSTSADTTAAPTPVQTPTPSAEPSVAFVGNDTCSTLGQKPYGLPATNGPPVGLPVAEMPHTHVAPPTRVTCLHDPPASGCHYSVAGTDPAPVAPGIYNDAVQPERWVHNLEHGYVVVTYNCPTGCTADVQALTSWYHSLPPDPQLAPGCGAYPKVVVVPETTMQAKFAMVSWDWYDPMPLSLDVSEVSRFYANHVDRAPEAGVC